MKKFVILNLSQFDDAIMKPKALKTALLMSTTVLFLSACGGEKPAENNANAETNASTQATTNKIRIATESNYKPFSYLDNQGNHQGFEIDLIHALCDDMKVVCEISSQDWDSLIPNLQANKYDAIFASMSATEERKKVIAFSEPYFNNQLVLVGKKDDPTTIEGIDGKNVAAQQATVASGYLETNHPKAVIKVYDKQVNAYLDLNAGRVNFLLSDIAPATDWLRTPEAAAFEIKGSPIDINDNVAIAMRQEDTELHGKFNAALANLKQNGEYEKIFGKYFDANLLKK